MIMRLCGTVAEIYSLKVAFGYVKAKRSLRMRRIT